MNGTLRAAAGVVLLTVVLAGCGGAKPGARQPVPASQTSAGSAPTGQLFGQVTPGRREQVPSALRGASGLPAPIVSARQLQDGGPGPDGIPAIDHPRFLPADSASFLSDTEPVIAVDVGGQHRAYPVQILIWHEIVNDTIAGIPVAVTYCPLCNSALTFDRRAAGRVLDFGVSGKLYQSDQVMYDRQTESLWAQFVGQSIAGLLTGTRLRDYPTQTVPWGGWRAANPKGWVLSRETGFVRDYGTNPYAGYDSAPGRPFLFNGRLDPRLAARRRVVGLGAGPDALAVAWPAPARPAVLNVRVAGAPVTVWWQPGTRSPLDAGTVAAGQDIGASGAFRPELDGRGLLFSVRAGAVVDAQTGSHWSLAGRAESGPLAGRSLTPVAHVDSFWFAWLAFWPHTRLVT